MKESAKRIKVLSVETANRIAAGEVVERPASVLKELLENSLDAGATRIDVNIEGAGSKLIRVADNGQGMSPEDLELCLERHATSKLASADDLERVLSLGFRGEALPSIASVSKFSMRSRLAGQETGYQITSHGGIKGELGQVGCPVGTVVQVEDLFFNIPARRKFLKAPATEAGHLAAALLRLALARYEVAFTYNVSGQNLYQLPAGAGLKARVGALLGRETLPHLVWVEDEIGPLKVRGFTSLPSLSRPNADQIYVFINGRFVRDKVLLHAVNHAYSELMPTPRKPVAVLHISLDPALVDVNVHPAKIEVRFRDGQAVHQALSRALRSALQRGAPDEDTGASLPAGGPLAVGAAAPLGTPMVRESSWPQMGQRPWGKANASIASYSQSHAGRKSAGLCSKGQVVAGSGSAAPFKAAPMFQAVEKVQALGQLHNLYILAAEADGLLIVDQHAAHERLNYEKLKQAFEQGEALGQPLLSPLALNLNPQEIALAQTAANTWTRLGLELVPFGPRTWAVAAVPAHWAGLNPAPLVAELMAETAVVEPESYTFVEKSLRSLACHSSVLAGMRLTLPAMQDLLNRLFELPPPLTCPHGRPVVLRIGAPDLRRAFGRE